MKVSFNWVIISLMALPYALLAQDVTQRKADSIKTVLAGEKDADARIGGYDALVQLYLPVDAALSKRYNDEILEISNRAKNPHGRAIYHFNMTRYLSFVDNPADLRSHAKTAADLFLATKDTARYLVASSMLAQSFIKSEDSANSAAVIRRALKIAGSGHFEKGRAGLLINKSDLARDHFDFSGAATALEEALVLFRKIKNPQGVQVCYNRMYSLNEMVGNKQQALHYALLALEANASDKVLNNPGNQAMLLNAVADCYIALGKDKAAVPYLTKELAVLQQHGFFQQSQLPLANLAGIYMRLKDYRRCLEASEKALYYLQQGDINFTPPLELCNYIRHCAFVLGDRATANHYSRLYRQAEAKARNIQDEKIVSIYRQGATTDSLMGNYREALIQFQRYTAARDTIRKARDTQKFDELQARFELADKNLQLKDLVIAQQKNKLDLARQRDTILGILALLTIFIALAVAFWLAYRAKRKNNRILDQKNQLINKSLEEKRLLLREIHHRVKNNLQLVISLLNIQAREQEHDLIEDFLDKGRARIISMALIHQNLYEAENLAKVDFHDYLTRLVAAAVAGFKADGQHLVIDVDARGIFFDIQTAIPLGLIVNELLCNSLKYAFGRGEGVIKIKAVRSGDGFALSFSDNGKGFDDTSGKGSFGLELVRLLTLQLKGTLAVDASEGASYNISFSEQSGLDEALAA